MTASNRTAAGRKPRGYWNDSANVIAAARAIVEKHGPEALTSKWLISNGHSNLSKEIAKHGDYSWIRAELGLEQGQKPPGYWNDFANVITEAKGVIDKCGADALTASWLAANGHSSLSSAITKHGGIAWLRAELGLGQGRKPQGYWDDSANVITEAKAVVEEHGPKALTRNWLAANGYGGLSNAIQKHGDFSWIRAALGLEQGQKPLGYWSDSANVITEAKAIVEEFGPEALTSAWLAANGHSSLSSAITKHGGIAWLRAELGLGRGMNPSGHWKDPANVITEAKAVVEKHGPEALIRSWLAANGYGGLNRGITLHGGIAWLRVELGLEQGKKSHGYWQDPANVISEAQAIVEERGSEALTAEWLNANGHGSLSVAIAKHGGIAWLRAELGVDAPAKPSGFGDSVQHALDCTGRHSHVRECSFYIYGLVNHPDFAKLGIAFDVEHRVRKSEGQYDEQHYCKTFATRQETYLFEQAVRDATRGCADCPEELLDWDGASEVRAMAAEDLIAVAERLLEEMEELGVWEFAARYVPMTAAQRAICQQRALVGAPACAAAQ